MSRFKKGVHPYQCPDRFYANWLKRKLGVIDMEAEDTPKYCRLCGSHDHWAYDCPERGRTLIEGNWEKKHMTDGWEEIKKELKRGKFWRDANLH